jgi:hypothetical protein
VAEGAQLPRAQVSTELLFEDVQRQLIALHEVLAAEEIVPLLPALTTAAQMRRRLRELLHPLWTVAEGPGEETHAAHPASKKREHKSAYRLIQQYRLAQKKRVLT